MKKIYITAVLFFAISAILGGLIFAGPMGFGEKFTYLQLVISTVLSIGAAIIYFMAFKAFWRRLKIAYGFICVAILMLAVSTMQFFVLADFFTSDSILVKYGIENLAFIIMMTFLYIGTALFAKLVAATSFFTKIPIGLGIALVIGVVGALFVPIPTQPINITLASQIYETVLLVFASLLVYRSIHVVSPLYAPALWLLFGYLVFACIGTGGAVLSLNLLPLDHWVNTSGIGMLPYALGCTCVILSAVAFNRIAYVEKSPAKIAKGKQMSSVDVVMYMANLASSPSFIDPTLDKVRAVTARQGSNKQLTTEQQKTMGEVYLEIEKFLSTKEPVRKFMASDLRELVVERYKYNVDELNFWETVNASKPQNKVSA